MTELTRSPDEDQLLKLAYEARVRAGSAKAAALLGANGTTYVAVEIHLPSLELSAMSLAVAMAVNDGVKEIDAAVVSSTHGINAVVELDALRDLVGKGRSVLLGGHDGAAVAVRST